MSACPPRPAASFAARSKRWTSGAARPEPKSSQNAQRNYERCLALARAEAQIGNTVGAENYYQYAEHCHDGRLPSGRWRWPTQEVLDGVLLGRVSLENVNWNMGVRKMTDSGGLSWEAQEVLQKIKSFNRLPGAGIPLIQLNMRVGSAKTVKKGIPELKSAGLITDTASGEPTLTDKGYKTSV